MSTTPPLRAPVRRSSAWRPTPPIVRTRSRLAPLALPPPLVTALAALAPSIADPGRDAAPFADPHAQQQLLINHIHALRKLPGHDASQVVFIPESNLGFEAQHHAMALERSKVPQLVTLREGPQQSIGLLTTNDTKAAQCKLLQELLQNSALSVCADMVCLSMEPAEALQQLVGEMKNFSIVVEPPKNAFAKSKMTFSGKLGGQNDDLIIALQLALLGMRRFLNNPLYASFRKVSDVAYATTESAHASQSMYAQRGPMSSYSATTGPSFVQPGVYHAT